MNILYCGDKNIEDGLLISILSLLKNVREELCIYVLTIQLEWKGKIFQPVSNSSIEFLDNLVKQKNSNSFVKKFDITEMYENEKPSANLNTRFTPFCMIRLYADKLQELPDKILYLDNDVVCRKDCGNFYNQDIDSLELVGVLDHIR